MSQYQNGSENNSVNTGTFSGEYGRDGQSVEYAQDNVNREQIRNIGTATVSSPNPFLDDGSNNGDYLDQLWGQADAFKESTELDNILNSYDNNGRFISGDESPEAINFSKNNEQEVLNNSNPNSEQQKIEKSFSNNNQSGPMTDKKAAIEAAVNVDPSFDTSLNLNREVPDRLTVKKLTKAVSKLDKNPFIKSEFRDKMMKDSLKRSYDRDFPAA